MKAAKHTTYKEKGKRNEALEEHAEKNKDKRFFFYAPSIQVKFS